MTHTLPDPQLWETFRVPHNAKVHLSAIPTASTAHCADKPRARAILKQYRRQIGELAFALAAEKQRSLLIVLQGVDAAGKDGAIRHVFTGVNPQHCRVISFQEPDREESAHHFLWRIVRSLPERGQMAVFNRSQYEDILVGRARGQLSLADSRRRIREIVNFERAFFETSPQHATIVRKIFLHISPEEQTARFQSRLDTPEKHWKVKESDFADRKLWPRFQAAYEDILNRTNTACAPWYILPADHKWYRDTALAGIVLNALHSMNPQLPMPRLDPAKFHL